MQWQAVASLVTISPNRLLRFRCLLKNIRKQKHSQSQKPPVAFSLTCLFKYGPTFSYSKNKHQ